MAQKLTTYWRLHRTAVLFALLSFVLYYTFSYQLIRTDFSMLLALYIGLFFLSFMLIKFEKWNFKFLLVSGILFRLLFLFVEPNLSQDFYRFIWDGELIKNGLNPYIYTPNELIQKADLAVANANELYEGMGSLSAKHYSNYPPLNQIIFTISSFFSGGSILGAIISMRVIIILADIGILFFGRKLLLQLNSSKHLAFWYFLNPLVIIELTGNLHFEGVMLFFFVWSLYLLSLKKYKTAAPIYCLLYTSPSPRDRG